MNTVLEQLQALSYEPIPVPESSLATGFFQKYFLIKEGDTTGKLFVEIKEYDSLPRGKGVPTFELQACFEMKDGHWASFTFYSFRGITELTKHLANYEEKVLAVAKLLGAVPQE